MSATNRGGRRRDQDVYPTPVGVIDNFLAARPVGGHVLDPAAGYGHFAHALYGQKRPPKSLHQLDVRPKAVAVCRGLGLKAATAERADFLTWAGGRRYDAVITNPPYRLAAEFVRQAHRFCLPSGQVVMLLRLAFLESVRRRPFWREFPVAALYVISKRPSFTPDGRTDAAAYAWFVWEPRGGRAPVFFV